MVNNLSGGITSKGKLNGSLAIGKIGGISECKKNVYVGESPEEYTEVWFDLSKEGIIDEVATKKFLEERTVKLETSLETLESEVDDINSSLDNLENEVNELKEGNIDIDLTNYVTKSELSTKADKTELHSHSNKDVLDGITTSKISEWDSKSNFDGDYNNLTNIPTIPTETSQLNNDSGFITSIPSEYITETELNEVVEEVVETKVTEVVETKVDEIIGDTLEDKINESLVNIADYNVKNYGAKGDGITDDTNAIISAINDFTLKGGNKLIFPSGSYKITSPLLIDLNNNRFMSIEMNGYILPASGVGSCISLINGANVNAIIKVKGGTDVTGLGCGLYMSAISSLMLTMYTEDIIGIGCKIVNCNQSNINIISTGCDTALSIDGLSESNININSKNDKNICYVSSSTNSIENVNFKIIGKDTEFTGFETSKGEWLFDSVTLTGKFNKVIVDNKEVYLDIVNSHIREISLPRYNNVRVSNNRYGTFSDASPKDKTFCV